jgi:hypothetical protein
VRTDNSQHAVWLIVESWGYTLNYSCENVRRKLNIFSRNSFLWVSEGQRYVLRVGSSASPAILLLSVHPPIAFPSSGVHILPANVASQSQLARHLRRVTSNAMLCTTRSFTAQTKYIVSGLIESWALSFRISDALTICIYINKQNNTETPGK